MEALLRLGAGSEEEGWARLTSMLVATDFRAVALAHVARAVDAVAVKNPDAAEALRGLPGLVAMAHDGAIRPSVVESVIADVLDLKDRAVVRERQGARG